MHKIMVRFKIVKDNRIIETCLDKRLSFIENIDLLNNILDEKVNDFYVYDPNKRIFLDKNIPLYEFAITSFMIFYLFS